MTNAPLIIGLTGNIATGKSVVGHMLANSGGLEIDADVIANRMLYPNGPAYSRVIKTFGDEILTENGMISRQKLGKIVFFNPEKLKKLETIVHPFVTLAIQARIEKTSRPFVVIEAIKLLESSLVDICNVIWVSHASVKLQMERLVRKRKMTKEESLFRIQAQPLQSEKLKRANAVINTEVSFKNTWQQIQNELDDTIQIDNQHKETQPDQSGEWVFPNANTLNQDKLEEFWQSRVNNDPEKLYSSLGSRIFLPFKTNGQLTSLLLWTNWNFTAAFDQWKSNEIRGFSSELLIKAFETQAKKQDCEVILFTKQMAHQFNFSLTEMGFKLLKTSEFPYPAWQEAGRKINQNQDDAIWTKILCQPLEANR